MPSEAILGKRKRKPAQKVEDDSTSAPAAEDAQAIFRRYFEAQFAPLEDKSTSGAASKKKSKVAAGSDDEDDGNGVEDMRSDSEEDDGGEDDDVWGGLSGEEDSEDDDDDDDSANAEADTAANSVEIVDHSKPLTASAPALQAAMMSKREMRAYLSSRPPDATATPTDIVTKLLKGNKTDDDPGNEDSKTLLANDLALQRLISESHILAASNPFNAIGSGSAAGAGGAASKAFTEGHTRKLTTDLRLQKLGSKESIFKQHKMPMGMRQGINTAKQAREDKRRREAKENGIILETAQKKTTGAGGKKRSSKGRGDIAVDMPGMGKFRNGELRLSTREVKAVEMEGKRFDFGKKKRRRR